MRDHSNCAESSHSGRAVEHAFEMAKECLELSLYDNANTDYYNLDLVYADHAVIGTVTLSHPVDQAPAEQKATVVLLHDNIAGG